MTNRTCEEIRDQLVDYADGELAEAEAQEVKEHLAECPACRDLVRSLQRSLDLAQAIWLDNLQDSASTPVAHGRWAMGPWTRYLGLAAGILIALSGLLVLCFVQKPAERTPTYVQIEEQTTRYAAAARLLVATQILAGCEDAGPLVARQRQYILNNYPDTPAAAKLRAGDFSLPGDRR